MDPVNSTSKKQLLISFRALSMHLYGAAIFLIMESKARYASEINQCIDCLEQVQSKNAVAKKAVQILKRLTEPEETHI